jgi:aldehyde:ferredoxin oxidoreductase
MAILGGYMGKILLVNLTNRALSEEALPNEEMLRELVGGTGLGLYYLWRETLPDVEATDEQAPLIFMTGPLTGTAAPSAANYTTVCLNFDVPYAAGVGHSHGFWGAYLKFAGYDAPGADFLTHEPDVGYPERAAGIALTLEAAKAKALGVCSTQRKKLWDDCTGVCWFAILNLPGGVDVMARSVAAAVGWEHFGAEDALRVGERVATLMRLIAVKRGFTKQHDFDVSPRLLEPPASGPGAGKSLAPYLEAMVDEYYRLMNFEVATGRPRPEAVARLGLEQYA